MAAKPLTVSVAFPVFNEEPNLRELYRQVKEALQRAQVDYEMVFVDNGSTDGSLEAIKELRAKDKNVVYVSLSRNFGHQGGLFCGMSYARGDCVITMDADLQHPPALLTQMIQRWKAGAEVVYTTKESLHLPFPKGQITKLFYRLMSSLSGLELTFGQSDFRLLDRKVLETVLRIPEYHKFLRGQVQWVGFRQEGIGYTVNDRFAGSSKFSYRNLFSFAFDGIFAFSRYPLHVMTLAGLLVAGISFLYMFFVVSIWLLRSLGVLSGVSLPPGWVMLILAVSFLGSLQLIAIGILGEYVGRIYDQSKGRPVFIVKESSLER